MCAGKGAGVFLKVEILLSVDYSKRSEPDCGRAIGSRLWQAMKNRA